MELRKFEPLTAFQELYHQAFGYNYDKHERASKFFGVCERTCRRWYDGEPHATAHRYLQVHCKGYLPYHPAWRDMYIDSEGWLNTPHGRCTSGDVALLWRFKWSAAQSQRQISDLKKKVAAMQSESKMKMLLHTADYLNRLVNEITGH
ncbi:hypothetical protein WH43_17595 [Rheinheimera sp. KL1]|uniref:hypothetical protein n=1 Tax=Rheinheimera sp. KL1 TaxID=1635005 RepID=UPI0006A9C2EF|nr:hypothetical protein [Rheinheimera sp. KL1]KOO56931.1 hypothetical protein WH43_17595 [Rheinheimera sp. KL1]